jgi:hypothetical protein
MAEDEMVTIRRAEFEWLARSFEHFSGSQDNKNKAKGLLIHYLGVCGSRWRGYECRNWRGHPGPHTEYGAEHGCHWNAGEPGDQAK